MQTNRIQKFYETDRPISVSLRNSEAYRKGFDDAQEFERQRSPSSSGLVLIVMAMGFWAVIALIIYGVFNHG